MSDGAAEPARSPAPAVRVLVAEDEPHLGTLLEQFLAGRGHRVTLVRDGRAALAALHAHDFDVALTDVQMPGPDGLALLAAARALPLPPEVIVATGNAAGETAIRALRAGAYDAVAKPYRMAEVELLVQRAAEKRALRRAVAAARHGDERVAPCDDPALEALVERLRADAGAALPLLGEPGTGRRTMARALHVAARRPGAFVLVDLAAPSMRDQRLRLIDGTEGSPSLAQLARAGTLCVAGAGRLDRAVLEALLAQPVDELALVLLDHPDVPLGDRVGRPSVELAPLRARLAELPTLGARMATRIAGRPLRLDDGGAALLARRAWPGNLAELAAVIAAAVARAAPDVAVLAPGHLGDVAP